MTTYFIDEQMLGDIATEEDARRMVEILTERGYDVAYGHSISQDEATIANKDWEEGLDIISREKYTTQP